MQYLGVFLQKKYPILLNKDNDYLCIIIIY